MGRCARQLKGKFRRLYQSNFRKDFVRKQRESRVGSCIQCGRCCKLVYRCPFLREKDGVYVCRIYGSRAAQCRNFPIMEADLKDAGCLGFRFS